MDEPPKESANRLDVLWQLAGMPKRIALGLVLTAAALAVGLSLPVIQVHKLAFWRDSFSIVHGTVSLLAEGYYVLGVFLLLFSVLFPIAKLIALAIIWFYPMNARSRQLSVWWTAALGRWSMLDVFVVAVLIVLSTSNALVAASPSPGLYVFGAAVLASMWLSLVTERAERRLSLH